MTPDQHENSEETHKPPDKVTLDNSSGLVRMAVYRLHECIARADADHFTAHLYRLMMKADYPNFVKLAGCFPIEAAMFHLWRDSKDPVAFFAQYGIETDRETALGRG